MIFESAMLAVFFSRKAMLLVTLVVILQVFVRYKRRSIFSSIIREIVVEVTAKKTNDDPRRSFLRVGTDELRLVSLIFATTLPLPFASCTAVNNVCPYTSPVSSF